jgi:hypothetical protein
MMLRRTNYPIRTGLAALALGASVTGPAAAFAPSAAKADPQPDYTNGYVHSTDEYPIPRRMLVTTCTAEQLLDAAKDYTPMEFDRYMMEYKKHGPDLEERAQERIHWFLSLPPGVDGPRRDVSEQMAATLFDPLDVLYTDNAKLFVNNKGVVAKMTENCSKYPKDDQTAWDWRNN